VADLPVVAARAGAAVAPRESPPAELVCQGDGAELVLVLDGERLPIEPGALPRAVAYDDGLRARLAFGGGGSLY
jgi:hypothetical protein